MDTGRDRVEYTMYSLIFTVLEDLSKFKADQNANRLKCTHDKQGTTGYRQAGGLKRRNAGGRE